MTKKVQNPKTEISQPAICPECGLSQEEWTGNSGCGYAKEGENYCCKGCAEDNACTCSN